MKLMLGTAQFGRNYGIANKNGRPPTEEVFKIFEMAKNNNISFIDTGNDYGVSEDLIGDISTKLGFSFNTVTKIYLNSSATSIKDEINKSLERLKTDCLFGLLVHNPNDLLSPGSDEWIDTFLDFKKRNLVKHIGVSAGTVDQILKIIDIYPIDIVQVPLNVFDQRFADVITILKERNIKIHVRSVFLQGLILMDTKNINEYFTDIESNIEQLNNVSKQHNISVRKLAMEYIKSLDIDNIVVGIDNLEQLKTLIYEYNEPFAHSIDFKQFAVKDERFINPGRWPIGGWR